jgi:hypothetical protein
MRLLHTPIRLVSGVEAANWAEPDGNQVNAIESIDANADRHIRQRFLANGTKFRLLHKGGIKVPRIWDGFRRPVDATRVARKS